MRTIRLGRSAILGFLLAASLPLAPAGFAEERNSGVGLIMRNLPPAGSTDYKALRKLAGKATGQTLGMTKAEMWNVPAGRVERVITAATQTGVVVTRLGADWNHALTPMVGDTPMSAAAKGMMEQTTASKAVMGVAMMALPEPGTMEYALTKDMGSVTTGQPQPTIVIPLSAGLSVVARRTSVMPLGDGCVWRGVVEDTGEAVTLMWWPAGRLTGNIAYKGHVYAIKSMGESMHGVVEMSPDAMPPEHAPAGPEQMRKMNMAVDPLVRQGDASMMMSPASSGQMETDSVGPARRDTRNLEDARDPAAKRARVRRLGISHEPKRRQKRGPVTIDLLVAYTKSAAAHYSDIRLDLIALAVEEANQSMRNSGIGDVRLRVVETHETDYAEGGSHFDHVFQLLETKDGVMDEIPRLRDQVKADVAVLIVHDPMGCGLAAKVGAEANRAFAVVHHECAATQYSLAHEVGHIIGARHDLALDDSKSPFPHGHGFVNGTSWRTMMSYKDSCGGCPRLPIWSSPGFRIKGVRAGDRLSDNARVIREEARRVAAFR